MKKPLGFYFTIMFNFSISQKEINVCSIAFIYQLLKSGLLHLTSQPFCENGRSAKVKDGIINLILRNNLIDRCKHETTHFVQRIINNFETFH